MLNVDFTRYIIDVHRSLLPGKLCFVPITLTETGEDGIVAQLAYIGERPLAEPYQVIGYQFESSTTLEFDTWFAMQEPWLSKLNILKGNYARQS